MLLYAQQCISIQISCSHAFVCVMCQALLADSLVPPSSEQRQARELNPIASMSSTCCPISRAKNKGNSTFPLLSPPFSCRCLTPPLCSYTCSFAFYFAFLAILPLGLCECRSFCSSSPLRMALLTDLWEELNNIHISDPRVALLPPLLLHQPYLFLSSPISVPLAVCAHTRYNASLKHRR